MLAHSLSRRFLSSAAAPVSGRARPDAFAFQRAAGNRATRELLSGGRPLPGRLRGEMEGLLGAPLGDVRVSSRGIAPSVGAIAVTSGSHIDIAPCHFRPETPRGRWLIGHELTHVLQQRAGQVANPLGQAAVVTDRRLEQQADSMGRRALSGEGAARWRAPTAPRAQAPVLQRTITYNAASGTYVVERAQRPFAQHSYSIARDYGEDIGAWAPDSVSPQDKQITAKAGRKDQTKNKQLAHHVSHSQIEQIIVDYLNGVISARQFMLFTGVILTPSWLDLMIPTRAARQLANFVEIGVRRFTLMTTKRTPQAVARMATTLTQVLNDAQANLRYGHGGTNMSIQGDLDLRLQRGSTLDPLAWIERAWAGRRAQPLLASESSAVVNVLGGRIDLPSSAAGLAMSESDEVISQKKGKTASGGTKTRKIVGSAIMPLASPLRGPVPYIGGFVPVSRDTLLIAIAIAFLYWLLKLGATYARSLF